LAVRIEGCLDFDYRFLHPFTGVLLRVVVAKHAPALCGSSGFLVALGFREDEAEELEGQLYKDGALVYASCPESAKVN
jgi:hypothetical protein